MVSLGMRDRGMLLTTPPIALSFFSTIVPTVSLKDEIGLGVAVGGMIAEETPQFVLPISDQPPPNFGFRSRSRYEIVSTRI